MGCVNTKKSLNKFNGIFKIHHLVYSNVERETIKLRNKQKINSYSLFFVNSISFSPSKNIQFEKDQVLLVDLSSYYSSFLVRVWSIKIIINNSIVKFVKNDYNSIISKNRLTKLNIA